MMQTQTNVPKQVLLRLPDDVAAQLARAVPPRKRNAFLVDLVRRELAQENAELVSACEYMNQLDSANPALAREAEEWVGATLISDEDDGFDRERFEREFGQAQDAQRATAKVGRVGI